MKLLPRHLGHGAAACTDFEWAVGDEYDSLANRDVFGKVVLESETASLAPFDPDETNPFHAFVKELAEQTDTGSIDPELIELPYGSRMPHWPVFQKWLGDLTGGDSWAEFAVGNVKIGLLSDMPEEILGPDMTAERVEWLVSKIPPEEREREERRRAKVVEIEI